MAVKLRLARFGAKNAPFFRIVAIDSRSARNGVALENLGAYNPTTNEYIQFHVERIEDWLGKGAIPSDTVKKLYVRFKQQGKATVAKPVVEAPAEAATAE